MTPSELETLVRNRFNALNDTFFSSSEIISYIYDAEEEIAVEFDLIEKSATDTTVEGQRNYDFPSDAYKIKTVLVDDKTVDLMSLKEGEDSEIWDDATNGTPEKYYIIDKIIYLDPPPDTAGQTITIYYYALPSNPATSSSIDIPSEYHRRLVSKILADMYGKDQNQQMMSYYMNKWINVDKSWIASVKKRGRIGGGYRSVRIVE